MSPWVLLWVVALSGLNGLNYTNSEQHSAAGPILPHAYWHEPGRPMIPKEVDFFLYALDHTSGLQLQSTHSWLTVSRN